MEPVKVRGNDGNGCGGGFDFVNGGQAVFFKNAVRPAFHGKNCPLEFLRVGEFHLRLIAFPLLLLQTPVDAAAFQCPVRAAEPVVNAATPQYKFHQLPDRQLYSLLQMECPHYSKVIFPLSSSKVAAPIPSTSMSSSKDWNPP